MHIVGEIDVPDQPAILCFGEVLLRLNPIGAEPLAHSERLQLHVGGAEANVAGALATLGHHAAMVSVVPDQPLGERAIRALRAAGIDTQPVRRRPGRQGLYFLAPGASLRASEILYDREGSSFACEDWAALDWPGLLAGFDWLHVSGITPALGPMLADATLTAMRAARAAGVRISYDGNYRPQLWGRWSDAPASTLEVLVAEADLFFGNHRDFGLLLGTQFSGEGPERRREAAEAGFASFPNLRWIVSTARQVDSVDQHRLRARIDTRNAAFVTEEHVIPGVVDRIGTGDAFAAGVLHGLMRGEDEQAAVRHGLALACLKHSAPGDMTLFDRAALEAFGEGGLDVRR
ncbi:sugar kinase [Sphingomonas sp. HF-S4]|uniref:Sugar kinase n=1 Tax=Sphingomonas agrestis TaxID=3080540 RepID=A0ABU3Y3E5_9SPHN|nr:sugar kinase [Sphingomonas sp. HF-S4]MDV3455889.1 sugar kinase [Sphingomonas sp. HF-S4]